ncbi:potassium channel family protein [Anaerotignum propionicum]|jgi:trk system potassium uptake protein TrkA|uniref:Trk system potassium uptake protein TrkA n=1 Tax=Anaerotignum propionicum DSM 1682 TaxID=991789 RepID=A0A0X1U8G0_ANAPI|nr:TrkA family potassium uptake protein [Anaerotignum propionicum]AMJ41237.1 Trk system potassium uptake protein TrkA [Anaerotignum propionicum DSM 1682]SHF11737.1 trk system potassium uptake protein TrkA [[Clostridium] propionicum DSM 1682] [Anaerotignum propionicum DSM 1682]
MKRFTNKQEYQNYIIIIGCGRLGANLANTLSEGNGNVLIIDKNKDAFRKLSPSYGGLSIIGDATDIDVMLEAQMNNASAVIAVTNNDNANIMVAQIAREMFHIKRVIARLYDPDREYVYNEFGIDTICPAVLSAKEIDKILSQNILTKDVIKEEEQ